MKNVLVIGGGIAGIQASLDLADRGYTVYLVEKKPSIGGRMAQLDKTFPTNDCSICILAPKMLECFDHPNINVITNAEVVGLEGEAGNFVVRVLKKPRYVDEQKCTGCGKCTEVCRRKGRLPDEFNVGLSKRGAIYIPFVQAVPRKAIIDEKACLMLTKGKCGKQPKCVEACDLNAIDFEQKPEEIGLNVAAIVVATGFDLFDPSGLKEYGYGRYKNVITAMEYERLICAGGPTGGHLDRPSDGKTPKNVVFIQCVGLRDERYYEYCCSVCCLNSTKSAILAKEHYPDIETYILYSEFRAVGKRSYEYIERGEKEYGIKYIRGRPGEIIEKEDGNLIVWYEDMVERKVKSLEAELVVLCTAPVPSEGSKELARVLGIEVDKHGFFKCKDPVLAPIETTRDGIFICGYAQGPRDIPESVAQASATAAKVAEIVERLEVMA